MRYTLRVRYVCFANVFNKCILFSSFFRLFEKRGAFFVQDVRGRGIFAPPRPEFLEGWYTYKVKNVC